MDGQSIRDNLRRLLPNFPEGLTEEWLVPYVEELGPPQPTGRWQGILGGRSLDFWRSVSWSLECIDLVAGIQALEPGSNRGIVEMEQAYFEGRNNPYSEIRDGRGRTLRALEYLRQYRLLPKPPALLSDGSGRLEIMDGNHRVLAFIMAMKMSPPAADRIQKIYLGRPLV